MELSLTVNGQPYTVESDPRTLLLDLLREELGLRGTKYGCGEGECGACTVLLNGRAVTSCLTLAGQAHGAEITTIEGLATDPLGAPLIAAFAEAGAVQCGFCTPGFVAAARALLAETETPDDAAIQRGLSGNLCRCTGYRKIVEAVATAAQTTMAPQQPSAVPGHTLPAMVAGDGAFVRPTTVAAALQMLHQAERPWRVLAGGTDLLVRYEHQLKTLNLLDLGGLDELRGIRENDEAIQIGALTTYCDLIRSPLVQQWAAPLVMAAREVSGAQIQNQGTLAGNLANASPAADSLPPLYVLGAQVTLRSLHKQRTLPVHEIALGPGRTLIARDELITEILIPKQGHAGQEISFFEKVGPRQAQTIAKASVTLRGWLRDGRLTQVRVALGAVAPTVIFAPQTAARLMADRFDTATVLAAGDIAQGECRPIDDLRSTAVYRRKLVRGLLIRHLWAFL